MYLNKRLLAPRRVGLCLLLFAAVWQTRTHADRVVLEQVSFEGATENQRIQNAGFEEGERAPLTGWHAWDKGYDVAPGAGRNGSRAIRCVGEDLESGRGAGQTIVLNQTTPNPIVVSGWSRAEGVGGSVGEGYSIYVDLTYADGTNLWGQWVAFSTGTHDWERRERVIIPTKPVQSLSVYALFRHHTGTVFFDDVSLAEFAAEGAYLFENTPVVPLHADTTAPAPEAATLTTENGVSFAVSNSDARVSFGSFTNRRPAPFLFVRDVAAGSGFLAPDTLNPTLNDSTLALSGVVNSLTLKLSANVLATADHIELTGHVDDLRGEDRAVTVYVAFPVDGADWTWSDDMHHDRPATQGTFMNTVGTNAGATGTCSRYPFAPLSGPNGGLALAVPMDAPRHNRLGYDASSGLFYAAFDFGLSKDTVKFPSTASFRLLAFPFEPKHRFRAALAEYYRLFPDSFVKRVPREGLWMAFTDISTVQGWEDFGVAFHEGTNNVPWDAQHDILSFIYTEPMTTWLALPQDVERTHNATMDYLAALLADSNAGQRQTASKTLLSSVHDPEDRPVLSVLDTPWCNGAVFALNADPDLPTTEDHPLNQGTLQLNTIEQSIASHAEPSLPGWNAYEKGFTIDDTVAQEGSHSIRVEVAEVGFDAGASQNVALNQEEPRPLVLRAAVRAENVSGETDRDFSVYVDLVHTDGTPLYGQTMPVACGRHDFVVLERTIQSDKPFASATVHLLMRQGHSGTAWFDSLFLGEQGSEKNLLVNAGAEEPPVAGPTIDGTYIDSFSFWQTTLNHNRPHFASADIPLVFDTFTHRVGILTEFSTFEFATELARRMHDQGKLVMANAPLYGPGFPAHVLDVLGTETNWLRSGQWQPISDADLCFRRAMCRQKPYCFLMNTHYADLTLAHIERYMQRCLFYGMWPGFFSENASTNCFFENPEWYNAARPLFKKYIPPLRRLAEAGWQPLTFAEASNENLSLERYGEPSAGRVFLTMWNEADGAVQSDITMDTASLGWTQRAVIVKDVLLDKPVEVRQEGAALKFAAELEPESVRLFECATTAPQQ